MLLGPPPRGPSLMRRRPNPRIELVPEPEPEPDPEPQPEQTSLPTHYVGCVGAGLLPRELELAPKIFPAVPVSWRTPYLPFTGWSVSPTRSPAPSPAAAKPPGSQTNPGD